MAKQLLRFALSRLDLLDTQALDLENLDFALGRNTVLEFRDVGLVLQVGFLGGPDAPPAYHGVSWG
jgi:autophagy-related protein 2